MRRECSLRGYGMFNKLMRIVISLMDTVRAASVAGVAVAVFLSSVFYVNQVDVYAAGYPEISTSAENGKIYKDSADIVFCAKAATDKIYTYYKCVFTDTSGMSLTLEDGLTEHYAKEAAVLKSYKEEGIYDIEFYCNDGCGAVSEIKALSIAVDSRAPSVSFSGALDNKIYKDKVDLCVETREMFYDLMKVSIDASVKRGGRETPLSIPYEAKSSVNKNIYTFTEGGIYKISVYAEDANGHGKKGEISFSIDDTPPVIEIANNSNLISGKSAVTNNPAFQIKVSDEIDSNGTTAQVELFKKDNGNSGKTIKPEKLDKAKGLIFNTSLDTEGKYVLKVTASDSSGNKSEREVDITYDKTPPEIGFLQDYNEKYLKSFALPNDFSKYINDSTKTECRFYLNSKLFTGSEITGEGRYILQAVCEDEAGNITEKMIAFIIDKTSPKVIVKGLDSSAHVSDGILSLSLYDSDDYFVSLCVNGNDVPFDIGRKELKLSLPGGKEYRINVVCRDFAGNETTQIIYAET